MNDNFIHPNYHQHYSTLHRQMAQYQCQQLPVMMEPSPTETLMSAPSENYTSLFDGRHSASASCSPSLMPVGDMASPTSSIPFEALSPCLTPVPDSGRSKDSKKKRKSWGQVLPEPKTNLPPRKRAKTEDEKEQRRVERVLRNRRAAQSSRERKRQEVELLEQRNEELERKLRAMEESHLRLEQELQRVQQANGRAPAATNFNSPLNRTLASDLFTDNEPKIEAIHNPAKTINMAKLSPPPEAPEDPEPTIKDEPKTALKFPTALSSDVTQHSAAMLCDLPCPSEQSSNRDQLAWAWMIYLATMLRASVLSAWQRPLTQISMSLKTGSRLVPSPSLLTTILWLVTRPTAPSKRRSKSQSTSTWRNSMALLQSLGWRPTTAALTSGTLTKVTNLKVKLLRRILSCSPNLARPLADATFAALRLASNESHNLTVNTPVDVTVSSPVDGELTELLKQMFLPPRETLLALAWTLRCEMKKMDSRAQNSSMALGSSSVSKNAVLRHSKPGVTGSVALQDAAVEA